MSRENPVNWESIDVFLAEEVMEFNAVEYGGGSIYAVPQTVDTLGIIHVADWKPHVNITHAMVVRDKIISQGWQFQLFIWPPVPHDDPNSDHPRTKAYFWRSKPWRVYAGKAHTDTKAICLAAKEWQVAGGN